MNNPHAACDRALATANAALANALKTNRTFVDVLTHVAHCTEGCPDCQRLARQAIAE